jgi:PAS domain S-box-containing protein
MDLWEPLTPDYRRLLKERLAARTNGKPAPSSYELCIVAKNKELKWVSIAIGTVSINGEPGFIVSAFEITDRKQAEEALRESEEKFRVLAQTSPAAIIIYQDDSIVYVNPAFEKTIGYTMEDLRTMKPWDFVHPDYRALIEERVRLRRQGVPLAEHYDAKILTRDGRELWSSKTGRRPLT